MGPTENRDGYFSLRQNHEWRMAYQQPPVIDKDGVRFTYEADGSSTLFTAVAFS
jgi:hypothetical protein